MKTNVIDDFCRRMKIDAKTKIDIALLIELLDRFGDETVSHLSVNKQITSEDMETCEACEKDFHSDVMKLNHDCLFCPECHSAGMIAMYEDFAKLHSEEFKKYQQALEDGYTVDEIIEAREDFTLVDIGGIIPCVMCDGTGAMRWGVETGEECKTCKGKGAVAHD